MEHAAMREHFPGKTTATGWIRTADEVFLRLDLFHFQLNLIATRTVLNNSESQVYV